MAYVRKMNDPWEIKKDNFPYNGFLTDKIKFVLGYAILAPSTHNSQPWLFKIENNSCKIYYDQNLLLPEADPKRRDLYISLGGMIENLVISANYFGIFKEIKYVLDNNLIAEVFFQENGDKNLNIGYLLDAMPRRVNARGLFEQKSLPENIQTEIMVLNKNEKIKINFVVDKEKIKKLASLTAEGLKIAYKKSSFRKEMFRWIHNSLSGKKEGMPGYSLKMPFVLSFIIPTLVRFFDLSPLLAKLNYKSMTSVPLICIFSSEESSPLIWLEVGRLAERLMLQLNSQEIRTSIFVASIEMGDLYKRVQELTSNSLTPQFLFCAGYMKNLQKHSPRHNLESKLIK